MHAYLVDPTNCLGLHAMRLTQRNRWLLVDILCETQCTLFPVRAMGLHVVQPLIMDGAIPAAAFVITPDNEADKVALQNARGETRLFEHGAEIEFELTAPAAVRLVRVPGGFDDTE